MRWIEIIIVRAAHNLRKPIVKELIDQIMPDGRRENLGVVLHYYNAFVENDFCVHIQWEASGNEPAKSDLGIELAAALEEFGRVHHTIWIQDGNPVLEP